jgi:hypothetical protein
MTAMERDLMSKPPEQIREQCVKTFQNQAAAIQVHSR